MIRLMFHDSDPSKDSRAPHAAFHDMSFSDANPREILELRTFAFFP